LISPVNAGIEIQKPRTDASVKAEGVEGGEALTIGLDEESESDTIGSGGSESLNGVGWVAVPATEGAAKALDGSDGR